MSDPESKEAYEAKFHANTKVTGYGILGVTTHMPCPACAEPEWCVTLVIDVEEAMQKEYVCKACGRGFKAIVDRQGGSVRFEYVQTCGPDLPPYMPHMRRVP